MAGEGPLQALVALPYSYSDTSLALSQHQQIHAAMAAPPTFAQRLQLPALQRARGPGPPRHSGLALHSRGLVRVGAAASVWGPPAPGGDGASAGGESGASDSDESSRNGVGPRHLQEDHLLPAHSGADPAAAVHGGTAGGNGKLRHLASSLFAIFPKLPPDGSTLTPEVRHAACRPALVVV